MSDFYEDGKYLLTYHANNGEFCATFQTPKEIANTITFSDCTGYADFRIVDVRTMEEIFWTYGRNCLEIVAFQNGKYANVLFCCSGEDH